MKRPSEQPDPDWIGDMLDDLGKAPVPDPSGDLVARVLADAEAHMPPPGGVRTVPPVWQRVVQGIGGWGVIGGLVAATVAGFVVGVGTLDGTGADALWTLGYDAYYDAELGLDAFGWALEEG
ncbi:hypothetical protein [uncultured Tateyamaria sp.]|uniref:hypothetical protein n=1 Tax=uncultured Tateyamaria sp. TaxID=455651 RepID=UPI002625D6F7|nr:hypothetical protein [uncultured Tateyamaria sp.]